MTPAWDGIYTYICIMTKLHCDLCAWSGRRRLLWEGKGGEGEGVRWERKGKEREWRREIRGNREKEVDGGGGSVGEFRGKGKGRREMGY